MKKFAAMLVAWGAPGLFLAALLDGAAVPLPGGVDVLVVLLATQMPDKFLLLAAMAVAGSVLGNLILYGIARRGGQVFLDKRGRSRRSQLFREWFDRYGLLTVFISALVPLPVMPMKIFVACAGALGSSLRRFLLIFTGARIPRYIGLAMLGRAMGNDALGYLRSHVWHFVAFAAALFVVLGIMVKIADRRRLNAR